MQEPVEGADTRLVLAQAEECAVAPEHIRLRHRKRHTGLAWITKNEFTCLDRPPLSGQRIDTATLYGGLADPVLEAERIEVPRLGAEVLGVQHRDPGQSVVLPPLQLHCPSPLLFGIAEDADGDVNPPAAERLVPVLWIVLTAVKKGIGARSHSDSERLRKTLKRLFRHSQRRQAGIADRNRNPGVRGVPPVGCRSDMRREPAQELTAARRIVDVQQDVRAVVRLRPIAQHRRLNFVEVNGSGTAAPVSVDCDLPA